MRYKLFLWAIISLLLFSCNSSGQELQRYEYSSVHMGTQFRIVCYAADDAIGAKASDAAFARVGELDEILSDYLDDSELNRLSRFSGSGQAVKVSEPLFTVLEHSVKVSENTGGYFDMTVGPFSQIWRGIRREIEPKLPGEEELKAAGERVGYRYVKLDRDERTVELLKEDMKLDPGGIAKGYASDEALSVMKQHGVSIAFVDGGGDISVGDAPPGKEGWSIAIPMWNKEKDTGYLELLLSNKAVTTSGDLFQFVEIDGTRYSHLINPETGMGLTDQVQVTVIAAIGMDADAYASALSVMGLEKAKELVESFSHIEAMIQRKDNGNVMIWKSSGFGQLK